MTQCGTQATGLDLMIGRYSPDSKRSGPDRHPANFIDFFQVHEWRVQEPHQPET